MQKIVFTLFPEAVRTLSYTIRKKITREEWRLLRMMSRTAETAGEVS